MVEPSLPYRGAYRSVLTPHPPERLNGPLIGTPLITEFIHIAQGFSRMPRELHLKGVRSRLKYDTSHSLQADVSSRTYRVNAFFSLFSHILSIHLEVY